MNDDQMSVTENALGIFMGSMSLIAVLSLIVAIVGGIVSCFVPSIDALRISDIASTSFFVFFGAIVFVGFGAFVIEGSKPITIKITTRTITTYE